MRRRLTAILCSVLVLQFSAGAAPSACAESHGTVAPAGVADEHAHHAASAEASAEASAADTDAAPSDDCDRTSSECCVPAVSCGLTLVAHAGHATGPALTADDGSSADPANALPRDPAAPETPPPRA